MEYIIYGILAVGGFFAGYWLRKKRASAQVSSAELKAQKMLDEAKAKQKELLLQSQDKALKIIEEAKKEEEKRRGDISNLQARLEKRETAFSQKLLELQDRQEQLYDKVNKVEEVKETIKQIKQDQLAKLEKIAGMDKKEAKEILIKNVELEIKDDLMLRINKLEKESADIMQQPALFGDCYVSAQFFRQQRG